MKKLDLLAGILFVDMKSIGLTVSTDTVMPTVAEPEPENFYRIKEKLPRFRGCEFPVKRMVISFSLLCFFTLSNAQIGNTPPIPPPPPPNEYEEIDCIYIVEEIPRFPGCENLPTKNEKVSCANEKLMEFIYQNLQYPMIALENGVEGTVVVSFTVETDGTLTDVHLLRDIGAHCGEEAKRVVCLMNDLGIHWIPKYVRRRAIKSSMNLPIRFELPH